MKYMFIALCLISSTYLYSIGGLEQEASQKEITTLAEENIAQKEKMTPHQKSVSKEYYLKLAQVSASSVIWSLYLNNAITYYSHSAQAMACLWSAITYISYQEFTKAKEEYHLAFSSNSAKR